MMNKVYDKDLLGDIIEVYMDDMIVKSHQEIDHAAHLKQVFEQPENTTCDSTPKNDPSESKRENSSVFT